MRPEERLRKKYDEAVRLRRFSPAETLRAGFDLMEFGRQIRAAAEHAHGR